MMISAAAVIANLRPSSSMGARCTRCRPCGGSPPDQVELVRLYSNLLGRLIPATDRCSTQPRQRQHRLSRSEIDELIEAHGQQESVEN